MSKSNAKIVYKQYNMQQMLLLPPSLEELIPEDHVCRIINNLVEGIDLSHLESTYKGGGTSAYHPKMMLKVLLYGYSRQIYSCRKIASALEENIHFMWLSEMQRPNFRTINNFRLRLKDEIDTLFKSQVSLLLELGLISLEEVFTDGTKLEANANRYTFVWAKSVAKYKARLEDQVEKILKQIDQINEVESTTEDKEEVKIDSELLAKKIKQLNDQLEKENSSEDVSPIEKNKRKAIKKQLNKLEKDSLPRLEKYERQEELLQDAAGKTRNSYSKTDPDATFMRMKEDHMKNGQLKPAYNVQVSTENQFIVHNSIHQTAGDSTTYIPHMEGLKANVEQAKVDQDNKQIKNACADAGYGSEENYAYLEKEQIGNYVKYNMFHQEQKKKYTTNPFLTQNLYYNEQEDFFICPMGQRLTFAYTTKSKSKTGYMSQLKVYRAQRCIDCPLRTQCYRSKHIEKNRQITINVKLQEYRKKARENLKSEKGLELRSRRPIEVEAVFGHIKWNRGFKRFLLRGLDKVNIEIGLIALAHNALKMATLKQKAAIFNFFRAVMRYYPPHQQSIFSTH